METVKDSPLILYAEDDFDDFEAVREALDQLSQAYKLVHMKNGAEAIDWLQESNPAPDLVVLDLNMPVMDGKEVLIWMKSQEAFRNTPVMVFTTSSREEDIKLCQKHNCTFFRKPTLYRDLLHIAQTMLHMCSTAKKK